MLVNELEEKIKQRLGVSNMIAMTNGTLPIQIALKAMNIQGEVITTPFSYVATTSSILWEGCTPVFVDIHPEYLTIDESIIEASITNETVAILATHVFGNPCDVIALQRIAEKHRLKVIYDAAHCFGVNYMGRSIFNFGDASTCSFHATKLFHTGEGGAIFCNDDELHHKLYYHHNFGHNGSEDYFGLGINAKMSEMQAAMGLAVLPYIDTIVSQRAAIIELYKNLLKGVQLLKIREGTEWNNAYFPIILKSEDELFKVRKALNGADIYPRRYFYPSLNNLNYVVNYKMPVSDSISSRVLCLPLYHDLAKNEVLKISKIINENLC